jgi:hypothetical protein
MRTPAQIEASRLNGAKSHGPTTPEGKQRSSQNAVKHGLTARTVVLCAESHELFEQLEQDYIDSLQPSTILELHLVQRIAVAEWRLRRAWAVSTAITDKCLDDHKAQDDRENGDCDNDYRIGLNQQRVSKELASVERAEARFERTQARALAEFHRLRKIRPPEAEPIQVSRPDVSTSGRDPAQYTSDPNQSNEPKRDQQSEPEPFIVIPPYPKSIEEEMDLDQPPGLPLAS